MSYQEDVRRLAGSRVLRESQSWRRTPRGRKIICPACGATGYPGGTWLIAHEFHETCWCGKVVTCRGLDGHRRSHRYGRIP